MATYDPPPLDFQYTHKLKRDRDELGRSMINGYIRGELLGKGQHGSVFIANSVADDRRQVAIKAIKRNNPRENKMKALRRGKIPASPGHVALTAGLTSTEQKIRKEIAIMKKCRHAHVVRLYEVIDDKIQSKIYMVMEYMAGGEIKWRNSANQPILLVDQTRRIIRDVVLGLEYLHYNGIIHRDIKPANLLWTADRRSVKIADFGVSHFSYAQSLAAAAAAAAVVPSKPAPHTPGHTHAPLLFKASGAGKPTLLPDPSRLRDPNDKILLDESDLSKTAGTPTFMAPEVVADMTGSGGDTPSAGRSRATSAASSSRASHDDVDATLHRSAPTPRRPVTKAIDVWALGVTLYALLFGSPPFLPEPGQNEFGLYRIICERAWVASATMGLDRVPTGGKVPERVPPSRAPSGRADKKGKAKVREPLEVEVPESEGAIVMRLLDRLLQKDAEKRITLDEVKRYPWFLRDITDPERWIKDTAPSATEALFITDEDTSEAMSDVRFRWRKRIKNFVKRAIRPVASMHDSSAQATPVAPVARQKSGTSRLGWHSTVQDHARHRGKPPNVRHPTSPEFTTARVTRSRSAERPSTERRAGPRRGSETHLVPPGSSTPSAATSPAPSISGETYSEKPQRHRLSLANLVPAGWRSKPSSPPPQSAAPSAAPSTVTSTLNSPTTSGATSPRTEFSSSGGRTSLSGRAGSSSQLQARYSEDVLGRPVAPPTGRGYSYGVGGGQLSAEMRASSWGEPADYAGAYARRHEDVTSVHSGDQLAELVDEEALLFGAGGVANEPPMPAHGPGPGSAGPASPVSAPASAVPASLLQRVENDVPSEPDPAMRDTGGFPRAPAGAIRPHAVSPLALLYESSSDEFEGASFDDDDDDDDSVGIHHDQPRCPTEEDDESEDERELRLRTSTSRIYDEDIEEEDDDDDESAEAEPVEFKRRRPSESFVASSPPRFVGAR